MSRLTDLPAWQALEDHYYEVQDLHLRDLFADPLVAGCEGPPAPAHNAADLHRDPVRATARAVAHSAWRP